MVLLCYASQKKNKFHFMACSPELVFTIAELQLSSRDCGKVELG